METDTESTLQEYQIQLEQVNQLDINKVNLQKRLKFAIFRLSWH